VATFHGKAGKIVWNAEAEGAPDEVDISDITAWSLDAVGDVAETTSMAAVGDWKTFLGGFKGGTATVECNAQLAGPEVIYAQTWTGESNDGLGDDHERDAAGDPTAQKVFLELWFTQAAADGVVYFPAVATGISHSVDMNDVGKISYTFQVNGQIFYHVPEPDDFVEPL